MRDSVVFYRSFRDAIKDLPAKYRLKAYETIFDYAFDGKEPDDSGMASAVLKLVKPQIDANEKRYQNGKKGGRPKTKTEPKNNQTETIPEPNVNVNVNDNVNANVNDNVDGFYSDPKLNEAFNKYIDICRGGKKVDFQAVQNKLNELAKGDVPTMIKILDQSIAQGWSGLFPLKEEKNSKIHYESERTYDFKELEARLQEKQRRRANGG